MNQTKGFILHDGWSRGGIHYVAVFACFMNNGEQKLVNLACLPMPPVPETTPEDDNDKLYSDDSLY